MASIKKLQPGQIVYSVEQVKSANTSLKNTAIFSVRIVEVNIEQNYVIASWNSNTPERFYEGSFKKWKVKKPEPKIQA